jgi:hypothetical protein
MSRSAKWIERDIAAHKDKIGSSREVIAKYGMPGIDLRPAESRFVTPLPVTARDAFRPACEA